MNPIRLCLFSLLFFSTTTLSTLSGDIFCYDPELNLNCKKTKRSSVWAGFGQLKARAREIVYGGPGGHNGDELSHLIWDTDNALTFNLGFTGEINDRWNLFFDGSISLGPDNSEMVRGG